MNKQSKQDLKEYLDLLVAFETTPSTFVIFLLDGRAEAHLGSLRPPYQLISCWQYG